MTFDPCPICGVVPTGVRTDSAGTSYAEPCDHRVHVLTSPGADVTVLIPWDEDVNVTSIYVVDPENPAAPLLSELDPPRTPLALVDGHRGDEPTGPWLSEHDVIAQECARCGRPIKHGQPYEVAGYAKFQHRTCLQVVQ